MATGIPVYPHGPKWLLVYRYTRMQVYRYTDTGLSWKVAVQACLVGLV